MHVQNKKYRNFVLINLNILDSMCTDIRPRSLAGQQPIPLSIVWYKCHLHYKFPVKGLNEWTRINNDKLLHSSQLFLFYSQVYPDGKVSVFLLSLNINILQVYNCMPSSKPAD